MALPGLEGYTPEKPSDGGFEPFKYEGPVKINVANVIAWEGKDSEFYQKGCNVFEIEAEVLEGENKARKLWKRFNLDSDKAEGKKPKTPTQKLADQLHAVGLSFTDIDSLKAAGEALKEMNVMVKAWRAKFGDRDQQMWNLKGVVPEKWEEGAESKQEAAF